MVHDELDRLILNCIQSRSVSGQELLVSLLKERGHDINQATLSRRLKRLHIQKQDGVYVYKSFFVARQVCKEIVICPPNLVVIKTIPGHANGVAFQIDEAQLSEIEGTIAGDDTIFVAVSTRLDANACHKIADSLKKLLTPDAGD